MLEPVSVGLKFAFLAVLYLFLLWVSRSALKDLRRGAFGGPRAPVAQDETGMHSGLQPRRARRRPRRLAAARRRVGPGPRARDVLRRRRGRDARPRRRRDPARGPVRLLPARAPDAPGGDPRHRGPRLDERHLPQRRAAARAAAAAPPATASASAIPRSPTKTEPPCSASPPTTSRTPTPAAPGARTRTPTSRARRCSSSPTGWAARRPARSRRAWPSRPSSAALERRTPASAARSCSPSACARPTRASTRCRRSRWARAGMGTTITAAHVGEHDVAIAHVGDSRAYRLRGEEFTRLTEDHSLVEEMRRRGQLTAQEADEHPQRSIITRALGPEPDVARRHALLARRGGRRLPAVQRRPDVDGARVARRRHRARRRLAARGRPRADRRRQRGRRARQHHRRPVSPRGGRRRGGRGARAADLGRRRVGAR